MSGPGSPRKGWHAFCSVGGPGYVFCRYEYGRQAGPLVKGYDLAASYASYRSFSEGGSGNAVSLRHHRETLGECPGFSTRSDDQFAELIQGVVFWDTRGGPRVDVLASTIRSFFPTLSYIYPTREHAIWDYTTPPREITPDDPKKSKTCPFSPGFVRHHPTTGNYAG